MLMADKFIIKYIFFHISNDRRTAKHISYVFQRTKITTFAELSLLEAKTRKYDTALLSNSEFQFALESSPAVPARRSYYSWTGPTVSVTGGKFHNCNDKCWLANLCSPCVFRLALPAVHAAMRKLSPLPTKPPRSRWKC